MPPQTVPLTPTSQMHAGLAVPAMRSQPWTEGSKTLPNQPSGSSFDQTVEDDAEMTIAHNFRPFKLNQPGWCDHCDQLIWGILQSALKCADCGFRCHNVCGVDVQSPCSKLPLLSPLSREAASEEVLTSSSSYSIKLPMPTPLDTGEGLLSQWSQADIATKVDCFNDASHGYKLKIDNKSREKFSGRARILLNLAQPVKIEAGGSDDSSMHAHPTQKFWRVPGGLTKTVQLTSLMNTDDVIEALMRKLRITNPRSKFALFELDHESRRIRQLQTFEQPLVLIMLWGNSKHNGISFQERPLVTNAWEQFALIELENFKRAMDIEEANTIKQIEAAYGIRKRRVAQLIEEASQREKEDQNATQASLGSGTDA